MVLKDRIRHNTVHLEHHLITVCVLPCDWQRADPKTSFLLRVKIRSAEEVTDFSTGAYSAELACNRSKILHRILSL